MHTDPIADLLTRIRNAAKAHHNVLNVPHSKFKENVLKILQKKNIVENFNIENEGHKSIKITLKDDANKLTFRRISKPGQRIYIKKEELKPVKSGLGFLVISTSKGLMTNLEAKRQNLGGELICEIY